MKRYSRGMNTIKILRTIHGVGQGGFFTERFSAFNRSNNVVYDCGSSTKWNGGCVIRLAIEEAFTVGESIDYVFVSHFDEDHCNGLEMLCKHCKVRRIIVPLLTALEYHLCLNGLMGRSVQTIAKSIEDGEYREAEVLAITEVGPDYREEQFDPSAPMMPARHEKESGVPFHIGEFWRYLPFNFRHSARLQSLLIALRNKGLDCQRIQDGDSEYILQHKKSIKDALASLPGGANVNSLAVLSTPCEYLSPMPGCPYCPNHPTFPLPCCQPIDSSCLYLGDYDARGNQRATELIKYYAGRSHIGMLQLPHHGSRHSFSPKLLSLRPELCFVSCGAKNHYRHPHASVIRDIIMSGTCIKIVTEHPSTALYYAWNF